METISEADGARGAGAVLLGLHAGGRAVLHGMAKATAVSLPDVRLALEQATYEPQRKAWHRVTGGGFTAVRAAADKGAVDLVRALTSAGVAWPLALDRAGQCYGLPPDQTAALAPKLTAPVIPPQVVSDVCDVALARWASDVASTVSEPVSKATEDWVEVRVGNRIERRRVLRDDDGQFAEQGAGEPQRDVDQAAFNPAQRLTGAQYKALTPQQKAAYAAARRERAQELKAIRERRGRRKEKKQQARQVGAERIAAKVAQERERVAQVQQMQAQRLEQHRLSQVAADKTKSVKQVVADRAQAARKDKVKQIRDKQVRAAREAMKMRSDAFTPPTSFDESNNLADAVATKWPIGFPTSTAEQQAAARTMYDSYAQYATNFLDELGKVPGKITRFENKGQGQVPVLWADVTGISMLVKALGRGVGEQLPVSSFQVADAARELSDDVVARNFELSPEDRIEFGRGAFNVEMMPAGASAVRSRMNRGNFELAIPLDAITGLPGERKPGNQTTPIKPAPWQSITITEGLIDYLEAAKDMYLAVETSNNQKMLTGRGFAAAAWWRDNVDAVKGYLDEYGYPVTEEEAYQQFNEVWENLGGSDGDLLTAKSEYQIILAGKYREAIMDAIDDSSSGMTVSRDNLRKRAESLLRYAVDTDMASSTIVPGSFGYSEDDFSPATVVGNAYEEFLQTVMHIGDLDFVPQTIEAIGDRFYASVDPNSPGITRAEYETKMGDLYGPKPDDARADIISKVGKALFRQQEV